MLLVILLEEYMLNNIIRGVYLLWSIFNNLSTNYNCRALMVQSGLPRLVSLSVELTNSQLVIKNILNTLKNLCQDQQVFSVKTGPKITENLLKLIEVSSQENMMLIIEILAYTGVENSDGAHFEQSMTMIKKVLEVGIESPNSVKFTILKVIEKLFSEKNRVITKNMNSDRIIVLILAGMSHGTTEIKETATNLTLKMVMTGNIEMHKEPDILGLIIQNARLNEPEYFTLRKLSIEIIYRMTVSVKYLNLIILNSYQVLDMIKIAFANLHPEINKGTAQINFLLFDRIKLEDDKGDQDFMSVKEEDLISFNSKMQGMKDRIKTEFNKGKDEEVTNKNGEKKRRRSVNSVDTENMYQDRSDVLSDFSIDEGDTPVIEYAKNIVEQYDQQTMENVLKKIDPKGTSIHTTTNQLVKVITILLSCDIVYSKIFSINFPAMLGIILDKMIGARVVCCLT
jgi:hypothetical protein